ncbi:hypothetical protein FB451DRAFT_719643 [Mycena latifolia]|nr:hypothetical protein FB451DRAFT_719643 [Mycena latifolia]
MWIPRVPLLPALFSCWLVCAAAAESNYTIDDTSPLVEYRAAFWARNPAGFNISELKNGTVTFVHPDPNSTPTIAMNFSGTAVYIFVAYPAGKQNTIPLGFTARIDEFPSGEWTADQLAPLSNYLAFYNNTLSDAPHALLLQLHPGASLYFDYAIVTSDADPNSLPPPSGGSPSPSPSASLAAQDTSHAGKNPPVGTIVGGVVGGLVFVLLGVV